MILINTNFNHFNILIIKSEYKYTNFNDNNSDLYKDISTNNNILSLKYIDNEKISNISDLEKDKLYNIKEKKIMIIIFYLIIWILILFQNIILEMMKIFI